MLQKVLVPSQPLHAGSELAADPLVPSEDAPQPLDLNLLRAALPLLVLGPPLRPAALAPVLVQRAVVLRHDPLKLEVLGPQRVFALAESLSHLRELSLLRVQSLSHVGHLPPLLEQPGRGGGVLQRGRAAGSEAAGRRRPWPAVRAVLRGWSARRALRAPGPGPRGATRRRRPRAQAALPREEVVPHPRALRAEQSALPRTRLRSRPGSCLPRCLGVSRSALRAPRFVRLRRRGTVSGAPAFRLPPVTPAGFAGRSSAAPDWQGPLRGAAAKAVHGSQCLPLSARRAA